MIEPGVNFLLLITFLLFLVVVVVVITIHETKLVKTVFFFKIDQPRAGEKKNDISMEKKDFPEGGKFSSWE